MDVSGTPFGADTGAIWAGSKFWLNVHVEDLRGTPQGVLGGVIDLLFETVPLTPTGNSQYGSGFTNSQQGITNDIGGLIDEVGALATITNLGAGASVPFAAWEFIRDGPNAPIDINSQVTFLSDPGDGTEMINPPEFTIVGVTQVVAFVDVGLDTNYIALYLCDFNHDSSVNQVDVGLFIPKLFTPPSYDVEFDVNGADGAVNQFDTAVFVGRLFQPIMDEALAEPNEGSKPGTETPESAALAADDLLRVRLEASETIGGAPLTGPVVISTDPTFYLNVYMEDQRTNPPSPAGVIGGVIDISWADDLIIVDTNLNWDGNFMQNQQGNIYNESNLIDEAAALTFSPNVGFGGEVRVFSFEITAVNDGTVMFTPEPGQGTEIFSPPEFALVNMPTAVPFSRVDFVGELVQIDTTSTTTTTSSTTSSSTTTTTTSTSTTSTSTASLVLTGIMVTTDATVRIYVNAESGELYRVWWKEDLMVVWPTAQSVNAMGAFWGDTNTFTPARFYRLTTDPQD